MILWLTDSQARQIAQHARAEAPNEACGLIAGVGAQAQRIIPAPNGAADPRRHFEIEHAALVKAMFEIEAAGLSLIGIYHSHPHGDPIPSATDIREANYLDTIQVIVGLSRREPAVAAWRVTALRTVEPVHLHVGDSAPRDVAEPGLSRAQRAAIVISALAAFIFLLLVSLSLLPPAPPIPGLIR